jgi:hypothetical protein
VEFLAPIKIKNLKRIFACGVALKLEVKVHAMLVDFCLALKSRRVCLGAALTVFHLGGGARF